MDSNLITDFPIIAFETQAAWRAWLEQNHPTANGIWIRLYKKDTGIRSINHDGALEEALCYGWIDGQAKKYDEVSYLQKFTPRRARSIWSKRNIEHIARLEREGRMTHSGMKEVEAAKKDGRWDSAYDSPVNMSAPEDLLQALSKDKKALKFYDALNKNNKYAINWRLQTAKKPETRQKRMKAILEMLAREEKFHN